MDNKYLQGRYDVVNRGKYKGDLSKGVIYRSSWELQLISAIDYSSKVKFWGSEEVVVPYMNPDSPDRMHRYFIDLYVELVDGNKYLIEVKPFKFIDLEAYAKEKSEARRAEFRKNVMKWQYASKVAKDSGMKFCVVTERELPDILRLLQDK